MKLIIKLVHKWKKWQKLKYSMYILESVGLLDSDIDFVFNQVVLNNHVVTH